MQYGLYNIINQIFCSIKHRHKTALLNHTNQSFKIVLYFQRLGVIIDYRFKPNGIFVFFNTRTFRFFNTLCFVSKPGSRKYYTYASLLQLSKNQMHFGLVLTRYGYLTIAESLKYKIGGELVFIIK